jgi:hypothetical protein
MNINMEDFDRISTEVLKDMMKQYSMMTTGDIQSIVVFVQMMKKKLENL